MLNTDFCKTFLDSGALISANGDEILLGWGKSEKRSVIENTERPVFYFPDYFLVDKTPYFSFAFTQVVSVKELYEALLPYAEKPSEGTWEQPDYAFFCSEFEKIQFYFEKGELLKTVPYVFATHKERLDQAQLAHSLVHLLKKVQHEHVFLYGFWDDQGGMLGATPELLFQYANSKIATAAVAGTHADRDYLLNDPKERYEHQLVIEDLQERLSLFGDVEVAQTKVVPYLDLFHLYTPIEAIMTQNMEFDKIVRALHPTPALGAYPRKRGMQWLKHYQTIIPRKRFGAPAGYCDLNTAKCYVAIRNMQWNTTEVSIGAGCGIVKQSQKEKEWEEINLKISATKQMLAL